MVAEWGDACHGSFCYNGSVRNSTKTTTTLPLIAILVSLLLMLTLVISYYPLPRFDLTLLQLVQAFGSTRTLSVMEFVSLPGALVPALLLGLLATAVLAVSPIRFALIPLSLVVPADLISGALKYVVDRPRPSPELVAVHQLLFDPGFPSSHVVHYTVFFGFLAYLFWKTQLVPKSFRAPLASIALIFVLLIPFSRMYLGAHWPTDVLGGLLLGGSMLILQIRLFQKLSPSRVG